MFNGTGLDEGLTVALAEQSVRARAFAASAYDVTGVTEAAQYMEGLMPKSTSFLPGAVLGGAVSVGMGSPVGTGLLIGGFVNRALNDQFSEGPLAGLSVIPFIAPVVADLTLNREKVEDIYSGRQEVPLRSSRFWEFGKTPYAGGHIEGFVPNWFAQLKADAEATPYGFGSKAAKVMFQDLPLIGAGILDVIPGINYHMERYHRYDRPYPISDPVFKDIPLVGPLIGATVGSVLKPPRMHPDLHRYTTDPGAEPYATAETYGTPVSMGTGTASNPVYAYGSEASEGYSTAHATVPERPTGVRQTISQLYYRNVVEAPGLVGFLAETDRRKTLRWGHCLARLQ